MSGAPLTPDAILQTGFGFMASRTLLAAVEIGLFTELGDGARSGEELRGALGLDPRANPDFFDALVATGMLAREGDGAAARYRNTPEGATFLDRQKPSYIGGILEMASARLYGFWGDLPEALRSGSPQNEIKHSGAPMFDALYADPARLEQFLNAMAGISAGNFQRLAETFDFSKYTTLCDVGGANALLSRTVAAQHPGLRCISLDLPPVTEIAKRHIDDAGLADRVEARSFDAFQEAIPKADIVTMGLILHDWNLEKKKHLVRSAYEALPKGGVFIIVENLIDDARRENAFGLLMSLNMLIEFGDAFDFTGADFRGWCTEAGFIRVDVLPLAGPASAAIAYK